MNLNALSLEQRKAAAADGWPKRTAIEAGAGAGKTAVLAARSIMAAGHFPTLACTFTVAAAAELRDRIGIVRGDNDCAYPLNVSTLHSWCYDQLRTHPHAIGLTGDFDVYDEVDSHALLAAASDALGSKAKNAKAVEQLYQQWLIEGNAVDYDGLIRHMTSVLTGERGTDRIREQIRGCARALLVDEAQDLSESQHQLIAAIDADTTTLVYDIRQSIYRWRDARPDLTSTWAQEADCRKTLLTNYRSTEEIVADANAVFPFDAPMVAHRSFGGAVRTVVYDDGAAAALQQVTALLADGFAPGEIGILGRAWVDLALIAAALDAAGHPVTYCGPQPSRWNHHDAQLIARWLRLQLNPTDTNLTRLVLDRACPPEQRAYLDRGRPHGAPLLKWARQNNLLPEALPVRGVPSRVHAEALRDHAPHLDLPLALFESLDHPRRRTLSAFRNWWTFGRSVGSRTAEADRDSILVTSIHGAKGLAWKAVILAAAEKIENAPLDSENRNLFYVASTRARDRLILLSRDGGLLDDTNR